jgi:CheY-like chemotaxis protein
VLNLNELVLGIAELLKRSLGDRVMLTTVLDSALWSTRADPSEFENAVLNLAINGRDAMPKGGKLVIETGNVTPEDGAAAARTEERLPAGEYVRITVSDTGVGMSPEVRRRAFEPFFTTKEGRGTGLGLSTVYGFAQQSGGHVAIESEPGAGTRVSILLPRDAGSATAIRGEAAERVPMSENAETVLVVEDDAAVRELTLKRVEGLGYVALEARNAAAAIEILDKVPEVALVFSDIGLGPGMSGLDLGHWVRAHRPATKVVLTTGYDSDAAVAHGAGAQFVVLNKPYSRYQLAVAINAALQAKGP